MLVETITSRNNPLVKRLLAVRDGRERRAIFIEGIRLVEEALRSGVHLEAIAYSPRLSATPRGEALLDVLQSQPCRGALLTENLMAQVSDVETAPGIIALGRRPAGVLPDNAGDAPPLLVLADGLQSPGNLGALVRTAAAVGATAVLATVGTADPFQPKALRASAGAAFRLPMLAGPEIPEQVQRLRRQGVCLVAADPRGDTPYDAFDWRRPVMVWFGAEGHGLSAVRHSGQAEFDARLVIPMDGAVESLNVAVAGGILLYEARRQRTAGGR